MGNKKVASEKKCVRLTSKHHALIIEEKPTALRVAKKILREWQSDLDIDEVEGAVDLALCEAAKGFDPDRGVKFSTYLYFFIQGMLADAVQFSAGSQVLVNGDEGSDPIAQKMQIRDSSEVEAISSLESRSPTPEVLFERQEIQDRFCKAVESLPAAAKRVVIAVDILEWKLAAVARDMGYSRGYLSEVRRQAHLRLREEMGDFRQAA